MPSSSYHQPQYSEHNLKQMRDKHNDQLLEQIIKLNNAEELIEAACRKINALTNEVAALKAKLKAKG
jgi:fructose-1,6-bisphosphatase